jgi:hypothetical protein
MTNVKALGNTLAKRLRSFDSTQNQTESPENTPTPDETQAPATETEQPAEVSVPVDLIPDAVEGDTYVVSAVDDQNVTLTKQ